MKVSFEDMYANSLDKSVEETHLTSATFIMHRICGALRDKGVTANVELLKLRFFLDVENHLRITTITRIFARGHTLKREQVHDFPLANLDQQKFVVVAHVVREVRAAFNGFADDCRVLEYEARNFMRLMDERARWVEQKRDPDPHIDL